MIDIHLYLLNWNKLYKKLSKLKKKTAKVLIKCLTLWVNSIINFNQCYDIEQSCVLYVCLWYFKVKYQRYINYVICEISCNKYSYPHFIKQSINLLL